MLKIKSLVVGAIILSASSVSNASSLFKDVYLRGGVGHSTYKDFEARPPLYLAGKLTKTPSYNFGIGKKITDSFLVDLSFNYGSWLYKVTTRRWSQEIKQRGKQHSVFFRASYFLKTNKFVSPFLNAGVGLSKLQPGKRYYLNIGGLAGVKHTSLSWLLGGGLNFNISNNLSFNLGYEYINFGEIKLNTRRFSKQKIISGTYSLSVFYNFN